MLSKQEEAQLQGAAAESTAPNLELANAASQDTWCLSVADPLGLDQV